MGTNVSWKIDWIYLAHFLALFPLSLSYHHELCVWIIMILCIASIPMLLLLLLLLLIICNLCLLHMVFLLLTISFLRMQVVTETVC